MSYQSDKPGRRRLGYYLCVCGVSTLLIAALHVAPVSSMWAGMSLPDAVQNSDLVIVATLTGVAETHRDGWDYGAGKLVVGEVLWGDVSAGDTLRLEWRNRTRVACPRVNHRRQAHRPTIWLLTKESDGSVHADHPSRKIGVERIDEVRETLRQYPFRLVVKQGYDPGEAVEVALILRNATDSAMSLPRIAWDGDTLRCTPGVEFKLRVRDNSSFEDVSLEDARWRLQSDLSPVTLAAGEMHEVRIPLDRVFELSPGHYRFLLRLNGAQEPFIHWLTVRTPWEAKVASLRDTPEWVPFLGGVLRGEEEVEPSWAIWQLRWIGAPATQAVLPDIHNAFYHGDAAMRQQVLSSLSWIDHSAERNIELLAVALVDEDSLVRISALGAMSHLKWSSDPGDVGRLVLETVLSYLDADDADIRAMAVRSLVVFPNEAGVETGLDRIIEWDPVETVRRTAMGVWQQIVPAARAARTRRRCCSREN